jgi:hypothetical protein
MLIGGPRTGPLMVCIHTKARFPQAGQINGL